jgi:hypothetical protein
MAIILSSMVCKAAHHSSTLILLRCNHRMFQEYYLCSRVIFFGLETLIWECAKTRIDECIGVTPESLTVNMKKSQMIKELRIEDTRYMLSVFKHRPDPPSACVWNTLASEYRARELTKSEDRIIALAGIARAFQRLT